MARTSYFAFVAALASIFALTAVVPAEAGRGHGYKGGSRNFVQNNYYGGRRHYGYRRSNNGWNAVGAGLVGLGVGAVIGSALAPKTVVVAPPARPVGYRPQPWTDAWYNYCSARYRSFNPQSGTYLGYDGYEHFCR
ncbi:MAG: BA14K family protein [Pseudomonadota bacterium]